MAVKKTQLYASLWASCDKLRGGMDSSEYKDYILTLLFMKYVTDKFKNKGAYEDIKVFDKAHDKDPDPEKRTGCSFDDFIALKGKKNIGEGMDKIIARLADENTDLKGVIDIAHFNDEKKLGSGKEMVDKLTDLISIFQRPELDFSRNKAEGDDIIGDAYEFLMRKFATESGKSKGQFYTPAEVSRILANVVGISHCTDASATVCDPACGSGSLLIRAIDAAPFPIMGYGQEKESTTAGLAKMNAVLHRKAEIIIKSGNTFSNPQYMDKSDNSVLERFDYIVANPPFSMKNWRDGIAGKEYGRFEGYGDMPPEKNGDYAWLMHILKTLKSNGKAAVILPHGVLFRGNAEATIRETIIKKHWIKGIISLPANLFYGTGIAACVLVIDKEGAANRQGIFMIDASRGYVKDGNKNRLRERDIYRIITTFNEQITTDPKYARFIPNDEIEKKNGYNLNITRYIDSTDPEDIQDIYAHIHGGIPAVDIDGLSKYWEVFPSLKSELLSTISEKYYSLNVEHESIRQTIYKNTEFSEYGEKLDEAFAAWKAKEYPVLSTLDEDVSARELIVSLAEDIIAEFEHLTLIDKYDAYQVLCNVDTLITNLRKLIRKKKDIRQGTMQMLVTGKKRLEGFSGDWIKINLAKNSRLKARIGWQGLTTAEYLDEGYSYLITGTDFKDGRINWNGCHYVNYDRYVQDPNIQVSNGDLLLTKDGTIGKVAYISDLNRPATLNSGVFVVKPITDAYTAHFMFYVLESSVFKEFLQQLSAGSTINHLYQKDLVKFDLYVPPTTEEQEAIAGILFDMDLDIYKLEEKLSKYQKIKLGMMDELLTGKVRLV